MKPTTPICQNLHLAGWVRLAHILNDCVVRTDPSRRYPCIRAGPRPLRCHDPRTALENQMLFKGYMDVSSNV